MKDFYFDDEARVIRYALVDTSTWLGGRKVLVSPYLIREPSTVVGTLPVSVSKEQIRNSPRIDSDKPISRQYEKSYLGYYGILRLSLLLGGPGLWGEGYLSRHDLNRHGRAVLRRLPGLSQDARGR